MYANKIGCTVYERAVENRMEAYVPHFIPAVYWEDTTAQVQTGTSMKQQDQIWCCIPSGSLSGYVPRKDDIIVCGRYDSAEPPESGRTITAVEDYRYGSAGVQHIEVTAV
ncbi:hypothetical protein [Ruminococcus sp.]|uniref:hypothetical protein n=1 Tax=Ruminococcus sp. TaxID=41978 RepID=UPI0025E0429A|nr:hypothetical protein [Ruminococcus sp.]